MNTKKHFFTTYDLILSALFVALISVGAFIRIPVGPVPITLQIMFVLLAGQLLKWHSAVITLCVYTALGLLGLPVFSGGGGIGYVLTPSFGYVIGFILASAVVSVISNNGKQTIVRFFTANMVGLIIVYLFGLAYYILLSRFYFGEIIDLGSVLLMGSVVFVPSDLLFCILNAIISKRIKPIINRKGS